MAVRDERHPDIPARREVRCAEHQAVNAGVQRVGEALRRVPRGEQRGREEQRERRSRAEASVDVQPADAPPGLSSIA